MLYTVLTKENEKKKMANIKRIQQELMLNAKLLDEYENLVVPEAREIYKEK